MKHARARHRPPEVPRDGFDRASFVERIAEERAEGWRARVFPFLFDPAPWVRDAASTWLCLEPALRRIEHEITLSDPAWWVRYNAASGWLADPDCEGVPEWVPGVFSAALGRERNAVVMRQILWIVARWAPENFPTSLPTRVHEDHGYARAGFALGSLRLGRRSGWTLLSDMLEEDEYVRGTMFVLNILSHEESLTDLTLPSEGAQAYLAGLDRWLQTTTFYPNSKAGGDVYVSALKERFENSNEG